MVSRILGFVLFITLALASSAQQAQRIVSLVPWVSKSLYVMGEEQRLVGCTNYCPVAKADKIPIVANAMTVNIEKTAMLKPDVVIASSLNKPEMIDKLRSLGVKVMMQPYPESFDEICQYFIEIGRLVGQEARARQIIAQQKLRIETLKKEIPVGKTPKILIQIGAKPLFIAVPNTFMDDYIKMAGGKNIGEGLELGNTTREFVLQQNPDAIFIVTMGVVATEELGNWMAYSALSAAKQKKIFILDADKSCSPTPILYVDTLEEIIRLMYR